MTWKTINGKRVYTREQHHNVLEAWFTARREAGHALPLISFDYHTDTLPAFNEEVTRRFRKQNGRPPEKPERDALCAEEHAGYDWTDERAVKDAIMRLSHDEHIDAAVRAGIVSTVTIVLGCYDPGFVPPWASVLIPPCPAGHEGAHDDACTRAFVDRSLEDEVLAPLFSPLPADYILDVDLDYFRSARAIQPEHASVFLRLVAGARIITVAEEPGCVGMLRLAGESIVSSELAHFLTNLIERAAR